MKFEQLTIGQLRAALSWSGNESATIADVLAAVEAGEAAAVEHAAEQARAEAARVAWLEGRAQASRTAYSEAHARARGNLHHLGDPQWAAAGREAAHEAVLAYERTHPLPPGLPAAILREQPSLVQRAVRKVKGKPAPSEAVVS